MISEYETKDLNDCRVEAHRKYIDLQYVIEGKELIGFQLLEDQEVTEQYSETNDIAFYKAENLSYIRMNPSNFTLLFPEDLHQPCVTDKEKTFNKKAVFKILK